MNDNKNLVGFGKPADAPDYEQIARITAPKPAAPAPAPAPKPAPKPSADPFAQKAAAARFSNVTPKSVATALVYLLLAGALSYGYAAGAWEKIGRVPTISANVAVLRQNIARQKDELAALRDGSTIDPKVLSGKEAVLASWIPTDGPKLRMAQADLIWQLASRAGLDMGGLQKTEDRRDDASAAKAWTGSVAPAAKAGSGSSAPGPYDRLWYVKYALDSASDEAAVLRFKELVETHPALSIDSFGISRSADGVRYSVVIKAYYVINQAD